MFGMKEFGMFLAPALFLITSAGGLGAATDLLNYTGTVHMGVMDPGNTIWNSAHVNNSPGEIVEVDAQILLLDDDGKAVGFGYAKGSIAPDERLLAKVNCMSTDDFHYLLLIRNGIIEALTASNLVRIYAAPEDGSLPQYYATGIEGQVLLLKDDTIVGIGNISKEVNSGERIMLDPFCRITSSYDRFVFTQSDWLEVFADNPDVAISKVPEYLWQSRLLDS